MSRAPRVAVVAYGVPRTGLPATPSFLRWVAAALAAAGRPKGEVGIRLVDAREGRALNRQYRARDYATNVLSFPAQLPAGVPVPWLGDLVLCAPVVAREAEEQGKRLRDHYAHLTVHGVLHLAGYDHERPADADAMEAMETQVLESLGIADPYRPRPRPRARRRHGDAI
jgi:probable rRNA maturation factor